MKNFFLFLMLFVYIHCLAQAITNYLGTAPNYLFNTKKYNLTYSVHPNPNYYKQEYIPADDNIDHFKNMIFIDLLVSDQSLQQVVNSKVMMLEKRKKTDQVCNYQILENPKKNEILLDFLLSGNDGDRVGVIEWNAYRYKIYSANSKKGVLLFAVSCRAYKDDVGPFLKNLSELRSQMIRQVTDYQFPEITLK
jgi:hypothetical protein